MSKIVLAITLLAVISICAASVCDDGNTCPGNQTCCNTISGIGCCNFDNGVCCKDGLNCCPEGYSCESKKGRCKPKQTNEFLVYLSKDSIKTSKIAFIFNVTPIPKYPSAADVLKCITDVKPVLSDLIVVYQCYRKGDKNALDKALLKLSADGKVFETDCQKIVKIVKESIDTSS